MRVRRAHRQKTMPQPRRDTPTNERPPLDILLPKTRERNPRVPNRQKIRDKPPSQHQNPRTTPRPNPQTPPPTPPNHQNETTRKHQRTHQVRPRTQHHPENNTKRLNPPRQKRVNNQRVLQPQRPNPRVEDDQMTERKLFIRQRIRQQIEKWLFIYQHLGQVQPTAHIEHPRNIKLAANAKISYGARLIATPTSSITIGANTRIGPDAKLLAFNEQGEPNKSITIGDNVFVGANAVILQGAVIGDNSVIGANAVVTKNTVIPSGELWTGVPAKFKRTIKNP